MSEVKWIKIATDIFNNRKIKQIRKMPDGDAVIIIWLQILCLAGSVNSNGYITMTNDIPYTDEMLAVEFDTPLATLRMALQLFERFNMIDIADNIYHVSAWEKYQNTEGLEKIREQNRIRKYRQRERERLMIADSHVTGHVTSRDSHATEEDKEEDKEKERERGEYQQVADLYNEICISFPHLNTLSQTRKKAIRARLRTYSVDDFRKLFEKAEASSFLKGSNSRDWTANFDWLIKDGNMAKVLDGNYDDKKGSPAGSNDALEAFFAKRRGEAQ